MKYLVALLCLFLSCCVSAQEKFITKEEADAYIQSTEDRDMTIYYEGEELFEMYAKREPGDIQIFGNEIYKTYGVENIDMQNCNILSVDAAALTPEENKALQKKIIAAYKSGTTFSTLIAQYAKDENAYLINYDLPVKGTAFEESLTAHNPGDIFTIEFEDPQGFYVMVLNGVPVIKRAVKVLHATYK